MDTSVSCGFQYYVASGVLCPLSLCRSGRGAVGARCCRGATGGRNSQKIGAQHAPKKYFLRVFSEKIFSRVYIVSVTLSKKEKKQFVILKEPIEQLKIQEETIYIAQRELAVNEQLKETIPQLVLVEHWVATNEYEKLVKGEK